MRLMNHPLFDLPEIHPHADLAGQYQEAKQMEDCALCGEPSYCVEGVCNPCINFHNVQLANGHDYER